MEFFFKSGRARRHLFSCGRGGIACPQSLRASIAGGLPFTAGNMPALPGLKFLYTFALVIAGCILLAGLPGCASTKNTSDVPWNVPQPWEGAPSIPGNL